MLGHESLMYRNVICDNKTISKLLGLGFRDHIIDFFMDHSNHFDVELII